MVLLHLTTIWTSKTSIFFRCYSSLCNLNFGDSWSYVDVCPLGSFCNQYVDRDALMYLILANEILHVLHPNIITIAEDVSYISFFPFVILLDTFLSLLNCFVLTDSIEGASY